MPCDRHRIQQYLKNLDFKTLFTDELGWDHLQERCLNISVQEHTYICAPLVEKRGVKVYLCEIEMRDGFRADSLLRKIEREVTRYAYEHILIYVDRTHGNQVWQWAKREPGRPLSVYFNRLSTRQSGELLAQKLMNLAMSIEEEDRLDMLIVSGRVRATFDVERATRRFFDRFKAEHAAFLGFVEGIVEQADREWYVSLMLNRLMFVYFIQKKGFLDTKTSGMLDGDVNYLSKHLKLVQEEKGRNQFQSFYRYFLLKLFHEGFGSRRRSEELDRLLGRVPYLNGGLFDIHELEREYDAIQIPDEAFERLFRFFDEFEWYLDDRPLRNDKEINPDVIGYIFEKYINDKQKQMGAYYTQEDITGYISKNTIVPQIFEKLARKCPEIFQPEGFVWSLLRDNPARYIYSTQKKGCDLPLPLSIEAGINDVRQRDAWGELAPEAYALPKETWREVITRRQNLRRTIARVGSGEIGSINDLITFNLDVCQLAQDVIVYTEAPGVVGAFYASLVEITILDPTCGSGAFLFAALNILAPLYEACLERMQTMLEEHKRSVSSCFQQREPASCPLHSFHDTLRQVAWHPNRQYFIYKSIIMHNLYGVDIMKEATEICKLRLFLKPVSQVEKFSDIEPLPDIDFNIRAGNALIGFATYREIASIVDRDLGGMLFSGEAFQRIMQQGQEVERHFVEFRSLQMAREPQPELLADCKKRLSRLFTDMRDALDSYLAVEYCIDQNNIVDKRRHQELLEDWKRHFRPLHWLVEFYGIIHDGGFDVVIGNPPYVAYSKVKATYQVRAYETQACGNLCAYTLERASALLRPGGRCGMIAPVSTISAESYRSLGRLLLERQVWISSYSNRPGKLFAGVEQRLAIILSCNAEPRALFASAYRHWYESERAHLFATLAYTAASTWSPTGMPLKSGSERAEAIFARLGNRRGFPLLTCRQTRAAVWVHNAPTYWVRALPFEPNSGQSSQRSKHYRKVEVESQAEAYILAAILSSSTFYFFYKMVSNCRDLGQKELRLFPLGDLAPELAARLADLGVLLARRLKETSLRCTRRYPSGTSVYEEYYPARAKALLDEIDRALAEHYGLTDEELDFILHYDLKYRMGDAI